MQYLILKYEKKNWIALMIITVKGNQKSAFAALKREYKNLSGEYWIFPLTHSTFYTYKRSKLLEKRRFYEKLIPDIK